MDLERAIGQQAPPRRRWRTWAGYEPVLADLTYERARAELRHGPPERQDELLAALVRIARHDREAVTVVVSCLLPGLRALITRHAPGLDHPEALAVAVGGLCEAVIRFESEPVFVASRLLRLPRYRLRRAVRTEVAWRRHSRDIPEHTDPNEPTDVGTAVSLHLAVRAGLLTPTDAWLIHATRVVGHSLSYVARCLGVTYEAVKKRRQRAEARWAVKRTAASRQSEVTPVAPGPLPQEVA